MEVSMHFKLLKNAITNQFNKMSKYDLFTTSIEKDVMWENYLNSFPEGSNPIYRERTIHDCSCCKHFIKSIGNVVAIIDNELVSIWDLKLDDINYHTVAESMSNLVKSKNIDNIFLYPQKTVGTDKNYEHLITGDVKTYDHFFVEIPFGRNSGKNYYCEGPDIGTKLSNARASHDVLYRSLTLTNIEAINITMELISQNSIYRGQEHKFVVESFYKLKKEFDKLPESKQDNFVWSNLNLPESICRIKNTAIGTLLSDLSEGYDLDDAVKSFEFKVAPANYKRPTALVTKAMIETAKKKIEELGLTTALERRYANLSDISINNIIFADREATKLMKDDIFDSIVPKAQTINKSNTIQEISIENFISDVVPNITSMELFFENSHSNNLVSLIAPVDKNANKLFKWDNNFSWSYNGDMTDSIKERVKQAGGNVTGDLCCRLAWFNYDDLDFHMREPDGNHIYFGNKGPSFSGGRLDVDMNAGVGTTRTPVENIFYEKLSKMKEGIYELQVHNYTKRETIDVGFEIEIDYLGTVYNFNYPKQVRHNSYVSVAKFKYTKKSGFEIIETLPLSSQTSKNNWNLATQNYHKVNVFMMSPNYWDDHGVGNKHYFFMLENCENDGQARGFFNEFLREELNEHRKVIEIVGSNSKTQLTSNKLSGLGFSSTKRNEVTVRVKGNFTRVLKIKI